MGKGVNVLHMAGIVIADPVVRSTEKNKKYVIVDISVPPQWSKKSPNDIHKIKMWGALAENCEKMVKKGSYIFISGFLTNNRVEGKISGTAIVASSFNVLENPKTNTVNIPS